MNSQFFIIINTHYFCYNFIMFSCYPVFIFMNSEWSCFVIVTLSCYHVICAISDHIFLICHLFSGQMTEKKQWWMLSIKQEVLPEGTSFVFGIAVLFSSYYNFNLNSQHDAACICINFFWHTVSDRQIDTSSSPSHSSLVWLESVN